MIVRIVIYISAFVLGWIVAGSCLDANAYEVPKDAVIKVFTKDGKQIGEMSRSEYKIVRVGTQPKVEYVYFTVDKPIMYETMVERKNSFIMHAGPALFADRDSMIYGATYCRSDDGVGLCASGFSNNTATLGFKLGF